MISDQAIIRRDGGRCVYCAVPVSAEPGQVDSATIRAIGGDHRVTACAACDQVTVHHG